MNELALFAGVGGGILGGQLCGWRTVCAVEINSYARSILLARQNDGTLPPFPIWDDIRTFNGKPWRGYIDVVSGGFPCQDISCAGKGTGITGERSGLWKEMARIISEVKPSFVYVENSPMLRTRGLDIVLKDLSRMGYAIKWGIVSAENTGALHRRKRMWLMGYANNNGQTTPQVTKSIASGSNAVAPESQETGKSTRPSEQYAFVANSDRKRFEEQREHISTEPRQCRIKHPRKWPSEPGMGRVVNGLPHRVDRLKALGNAQVPRVAYAAWELLNEYPWENK